MKYWCRKINKADYFLSPFMETCMSKETGLFWERKERLGRKFL